MNNKKVIVSNGEETMSLEDFLIWEMNGAKGNILAGGIEKDWENLSLEDKIMNMAISMRGDFLDSILPWKIMTVEINP